MDPKVIPSMVYFPEKEVLQSKRVVWAVLMSGIERYVSTQKT